MDWNLLADQELLVYKSVYSADTNHLLQTSLHIW